MSVLFKQYLLKNSSYNFVIGSCSCKDNVNNLKPTKCGKQKSFNCHAHIYNENVSINWGKQMSMCDFNNNTSCLLISSTSCEQMWRLNMQKI